MANYIQFYLDSACTRLWTAVPADDFVYSSIGGHGGLPGSLTLGDHTYNYYDDSLPTLFYDAQEIRSNPFLTINRAEPTKTIYCKNGFSMQIGSSPSGTVFGNFQYNGVPLPFSDQGAATGRYWMIAFFDETSGKNYIGFTRQLSDTWEIYTPPIACMETDFWTSAFRPPYDYGGKDDPDGGQGSGHYNHTGVSDSSTPLGIMPTGGRGLHYYKINGDAYRSLQGYLWGDASTIGKSLWQKFINRTHTPISCVIGCFALPDAFAPAGGGSDPIQIAGVRLSPIAGSCMSFDPGISTLELTFPAQSGADKCFTDYSHTTCKLYVPYCGTIPIPMELALDRVIKVRYRVDQANGNLCVCVWAGDCVVGELSGNCAYQIPVIGGDDGSLDVLGSTITGLIQISSGDYRGALQSGAEALTAQHTTQIVNGDLSGAVSRCSLRRPYIEYTRNANTYTPGYFRTVGIPARIAGTLSSFAGGYGEFDTQISSADIPGATGDEIAEITSLLREGVFV